MPEAREHDADRLLRGYGDDALRYFESAVAAPHSGDRDFEGDNNLYDRGLGVGFGTKWKSTQGVGGVMWVHRGESLDETRARACLSQGEWRGPLDV